MLGGVIFDFDGVIVDSHPAHMLAWKELLLIKGKATNDADLSFVREGAKREEILKHFLGELTPDQIVSYGLEKDKLFHARAGESRGRRLPAPDDVLHAQHRGVLRLLEAAVEWSRRWKA